MRCMKLRSECTHFGATRPTSDALHVCAVACSLGWQCMCSTFILDTYGVANLGAKESTFVPGAQSHICMLTFPNGTWQSEKEEDKEFKVHLVNTSVYLLLYGMQLTTIFVNYNGEPFMASFANNTGLRRSVTFFGMIGTSSAVTLRLHGMVSLRGRMRMCRTTIAWVCWCTYMYNFTIVWVGGCTLHFCVGREVCLVLRIVCRCASFGRGCTFCSQWPALIGALATDTKDSYEMHHIVGSNR